ncbi:MAG: acyl--CoA ligase [Pseudomonadota bacterium]
MADTIADLLAPHADDAPALGAPGRGWMSHGALRAQCGAVRAALAAAGIDEADRVAIVLPNGPEMAAVFLAVASACCAAPLNPAYKEDEVDFYLSDLRAKAIILAEGEDGPAASAAMKRGLRVVRLSVAEGAAAGAFALDLGGEGDAPAAGPEAVGLVLHTSGTTSRPKIVPLLQRNLAASARHIGEALALGAGDRCLNMMPLFHIHGLVAATLSSLAAGGSVWCAPGFDALKVFSWFGEAEPSWYTAVPTMHQAILARAARNTAAVEAMDLRLIRSSSASLPPQVMTALSETFGCPVVESYGMTEAAHQMTSNPLGKGRQVPGSVGVAAGPEVMTADEAENAILAPGRLGEVVISGPNVTPGYEANPEANAKNFFEADGKRWFRTGDQGRFDEAGYLRITGRLKEIINRGGEKVSPLEVDEVLMDHPAVAQAVTFAIPHAKLGEEVGAAVVLREGECADEAGVRAFVRERLAEFKTPRKVVILDEIPKGATGKLQRIGLAEKLGLAS